MEYFRESGKFSIAYMERATEKEYYLASAFEEVYCPPTALLLIRGFSVSSLFLRGALDKVGLRVRWRIGAGGRREAAGCLLQTREWRQVVVGPGMGTSGCGRRSRQPATWQPGARCPESGASFLARLAPSCPAHCQLGIEPEVRRIGKYKSAGDQLLRKDMSGKWPSL